MTGSSEGDKIVGSYMQILAAAKLGMTDFGQITTQ